MSDWQPEETAPILTKVIVSGGVAMKKEDGEWYTGMEEPLFERPINWTVRGWMPIPHMEGIGILR